MSILNNPNSLTPTAGKYSDNLKSMTYNTFRQMVLSFNMGSKMFWRNPHYTPTQLAAALGTNGKEIFQLHAKLGSLISEVQPEAIAEGLSVVGNFSYNEDGSVTINE